MWLRCAEFIYRLVLSCLAMQTRSLVRKMDAKQGKRKSLSSFERGMEKEERQLLNANAHVFYGSFCKKFLSAQLKLFSAKQEN